MSIVTKESNPELYNALFPKEEIKEILDNPKILMLSYGNYISLDDYVKLKDCITNLQQENERLKEVKKKAIEYIKEHQRKDGFLNLNEWQTRDLLNILQDYKEVIKSE